MLIKLSIAKCARNGVVDFTAVVEYMVGQLDRTLSTSSVVSTPRDKYLLIIGSEIALNLLGPCFVVAVHYSLLLERFGECLRRHKRSVKIDLFVTDIHHY